LREFPKSIRLLGGETMFQFNVFSFGIAEIVECLPQYTQINLFSLGAGVMPKQTNNRNFRDDC
jgi:hypothetical protein